MHTNVSSRIIDLEADLEGFGTVYFHPKAMANILSLKDLRTRHEVVYDSKKEDAFFIKNGANVLKFKANDQGLYVYRPDQKYLDLIQKKNNQNAGVCLLGSLKKRKEGFTQKQMTRAKRACEFYHMVGAPIATKLKMVLKQNLFQNCPVTVDDINLTEKIFGPDVSSLKGRSTRPKPNQVVDDKIEIPTELLQKTKRWS